MKPNVLLMISSFHQGGSERQMVQFARLLHETGRYHLRVACIHDEGVLREEILRLNLGSIAEFPLTSFYDRNALRSLRRFTKFLRETKTDVVQAFDFYVNIFGMTGARLAHVPARIAARRETFGIRSAAQSFVERRAFNLAHTIVANSEAVRQELISDGVSPQKIVTIYNGVDTLRVAPPANFKRQEALAELNLPPDVKLRFVTILANMRHAMKDQATFLRAAERVRERFPEAGFILAGEGELMNDYRALAACLGLEHNAFFIGRCADVAKLLAISEVCVLSSCGVEGFSNSIAEYMAAARPVVATDIGGAREVIVEGETGYIVRPKDDQTMAARIIALLEDPARARAMGMRGLQVIKEKFSCEAQLERTERLYEHLLSKRGARLTNGLRRAGHVEQGEVG